MRGQPARALMPVFALRRAHLLAPTLLLMPVLALIWPGLGA